MVCFGWSRLTRKRSRNECFIRLCCFLCERMLKRLRCAVRFEILDGCRIGIFVNELENWKMPADRNGKGDYGQDGMCEKRRLEMGPRIMETRKRDPGCKRDQEFWCRVGEGNHCGIGKQGRAEVGIENALLDARNFVTCPMACLRAGRGLTPRQALCEVWPWLQG